MTSSPISPPSASVATAPKSLGLPNVAFVGKAGAGKSTAAGLLVELGYTALSFAGPLKDLAAQLWGHTARTDRDKLQKMGVGIREIDNDAWVNLLLKRLRPPLNVHPAPSMGPFTIDDCRFENEWWALKGEGFVIVRIMAPLALRIDRLKGNGKYQNDEQLEHESETALDHLTADYGLTNVGSRDELYDDLAGIIIKERKRR